MRAYIDTSVIASAYKPNEIFHEASVRMAKLNTIKKVGSYILIAELFCVLSRLYGASHIKIPASAEKVLLKLPMRERISALVNALILDWDLSCPNLGFDARQLKLKDFSLTMPEALLEACMIASSLRLKTLDLMHISCAKLINEATHDLKYFVTLDRDILNNRNEVKKMTGLHSLTPQELINLL